MLDFDKTDLSDNVLIIQNDDGSITCIPEDGATESEKVMFVEFRAKYPNGKPVPTVGPQTPVPTDSDRITALESALSALMGVQ